MIDKYTVILVSASVDIALYALLLGWCVYNCKVYLVD